MPSSPRKDSAHDHDAPTLPLRRPGVVTTGLVVLATLVGALLALTPTSAFAEYDPGHRLTDPPGMFTEATITAIGSGRTVSGFEAPASFDPLQGYPAAIPSGSTAHASGYAGTIQIKDPITGRAGLTYCIDINTETEVGVNYRLDDWNEANVPNLGYIEDILRHFYPTTGQPAAATTDADRGAAVQASIWFFSDKYILATTSPVRALTKAIVAQALADGPGAEPREPHLTVTPAEKPAPSTGELVGPFTVAADGPATLRTTGVEVFADAQGATQLHDGDEVQPGARLWARSASATTPQGFVLERVTTVLAGTVLLYDGSNPSLTKAQKIVLAQQTQLVARAGAVLHPFAAGALKVTKVIRGDAAGLQGPITIHVNCRTPEPDLDQHHRISLPAGAPAGDHSKLITGIPAGSTCALTEPSTGDDALVDLAHAPVFVPQSVTIEADETRQATVTDTYQRGRGALQLAKTVTGPGAGWQDAIGLDVACTDLGRTGHHHLTLAAGTAAGTHRLPTISGIPAGSRCTATETTSGANDRVALQTAVSITPPGVTIQDGVTSLITITDRYVRRGQAGTNAGTEAGTEAGRLAATGLSMPLAVLAALSVAMLLIGCAAVTRRRPRRRP
ncbi:thioester domain-containing protein [Streptacidiphilus sp. EB103A]|uniref:thioester domain-containing protein n=1 Tax=Streptacidiphilus sp. EB103A TaxID=3156275 RepID=UPI0035122B00